MTSPPGYEWYEQVVVGRLMADHMPVLLLVIGLLIAYAACRSRAEFGGRAGSMAAVVAGLIAYAGTAVVLSRSGWPVVDAIIAGGLIFAVVLALDMLAGVLRWVATR